MPMLPLRLLTVSTIVLLSACAADAPRAAATSGASGPSTPAASPDSGSNGTPAASASTAPASERAAVAAPSAPGDTIAPRLAAGHNKTDATSFGAAIRAGARRAATWPAGPKPAAGALLPTNRIVAYYGNPHSKKMGVIGEYPESLPGARPIRRRR
jgi:hypothetical protein